MDVAEARRFHLIAAALLTALAALAAFAPAARAAEAQPVLGLPLICEPGRTCWLVNMVDHDPGPGIRDYACGAHGYNGHTGTDIAIRDYAQMEDGVAVVAAAAGVVRRLRDGMLDGDVSLAGHAAVAGKGCGNSVAVDHGEGWETFYCHLRRGSLTVRPGQRVEKGDKLGFVGSSGLAEFPHVHLGVRLNGRIVDPFVGVKRSADCGLGPSPLWSPRTLAQLKGSPTALYDAGFAPTEVNAVALRRGFYRDAKLRPDAPVLAFWVDAFWVEKGDRLTLTLTGPKDRKIAEKSFNLTKDQARHMRFVGKRKTVDWHAGTYTGIAELERRKADGAKEVFRIERKLEVD
jgi:murein DD-endopeptidase MepM/ murein hydrolase activator NlpD